jgi:glycerol-1-phosphatase
VPLRPLPDAYDAVLLDLDGCVWVGDEATPRTAEAVEALRAAGKAVGFVTNDARHPGEDLVRKLWRLGIRASADEVVTVGGALQFALFEDHAGATAYVVGAPAVHRHVADAGLRVLNGTAFASRADVVVVAGHEDLVYEELRIATQALLRGAAFVGAARDRTYPMADGPYPGTGAVLAALETATGRTARTVGKPEAILFRTALDRLGLGGDARVLVVGDRLDADVAGAHAAGLDGAVVLSGATTPAEAAAAEEAEEGRPVAVAPTLADLVLGSP